jgi:hypothetical protein
MREPTESEIARVEAELQKTPVPPAGAAASTTIAIDVYFHVSMPTRRGVDSVRDEQLRAQIDVMNRAYASNGSPFRFRLKGTTRRVNPEWDNVKYGSGVETRMREAVRVGGRSTLNVYISPLAWDYLGWTNFPWEPGVGTATDGVAIIPGVLPGGTVKPYDEGKTLVHEVGHWLGLFHTFQGGCNREGDKVADVPRGRMAFGCPIGRNSCGPAPDPIHNFMNYTDDACMHEFTPGQVDRMRKMWRRYRQ